MLTSIRTLLQEPKFRNTGRGVDNMTVKMIPGNAEASPQLVIHIADYLVIQNQSKLEWTKMPKKDGLIEWARTKRNTEVAAKQLAYVTAVKKYKTDAHKPKKWRKKSIGDVLKELNKEMIAAFDAAIEKDLQIAVSV
jgi:hypothetical protein